MTESLRDRIRSAADVQAPSFDLTRVAGRARVLRVRRVIGGAVAVLVACAAIAIPLVSLQHLGDEKQPHRRTPVGVTFGDGTVSFRQTDGWNRLQNGTLSACATTSAFAEVDLQQSANPRPNVVTDCSWTATVLPSDGVLIGAYTLEAYRWEQPSGTFPASGLPATLDATTCGAHSYEGQPAGTTKCQLWITANDRHVAISVWFGTETPTEELMAKAQEGLDALEVSEPASLGNDIAFEPTRGWYDQAVTPTAPEAYVGLPSAWTSNVDVGPPGDSSGLSNGQIADLPPDGVIVSVEQWLTTRNALPDRPDFQPLDEGVHLSDARLITGGWEGMPVEDVSRLHLSGVLGGRPIIVQAYFHTTDPSADLIRQAQGALNRLVVVPVPAPTPELDDFGVSMEVADGWRGWLYAFNVGVPELVATTSDPQNPLYPQSVVGSMGADDVTMVLEEGGDSQDLRWPAIDGPPQIGPENLCVGCEMLDGGRPPAAGHALYHDTFTSGGRPFDLYVEFGSAPTDARLADVNATLGTLRLTPDPSPGTAPPGGVAVGSLYEGAVPPVGSGDANRTLSWYAAHGASLQVPDGWTGWTYLVSDTNDPINLYALGSWDVPQGGYCAPLMALQQLPSDGALIWIDRYGSQSAPGEAVPWPASPQVGPGTDPAPSPTPCTAGAPVKSFVWTLDGRTYGIHVAFGPNVTEANVGAAAAALASFGQVA